MTIAEEAANLKQAGIAPLLPPNPIPSRRTVAGGPTAPVLGGPIPDNPVTIPAPGPTLPATPATTAELNAMEDVTPIDIHSLNGSLLDAWKAIIDLDRRVKRIEKGS